jgi:hypothetical protein
MFVEKWRSLVKVGWCRDIRHNSLGLNKSQFDLCQARPALPWKPRIVRNCAAISAGCEFIGTLTSQAAFHLVELFGRDSWPRICW